MIGPSRWSTKTEQLVDMGERLLVEVVLVTVEVEDTALVLGYQPE